VSLAQYNVNAPKHAALALVVAMLGATASAAGVPVEPRAIFDQTCHTVSLPTAFLLARPKVVVIRNAKRRAEAHLIDFVELMWPVLDPGTPFVRTWVQEAICEHLEAVSDGRLTKLLINVPPGSTKSRIANVCWPIWEWGPRNRPDLRFMSWSYSDELVETQNEESRTLIASEIFQRYWGDRFRIDRRSDAKSFFKNNHAGWRRSSSIQGKGTGFRADRLIFDDPHPVKDADSEAALTKAMRWFTRTLPTRIRSGGLEHKVKVPYWVRAVHGMGLDPDPQDPRPVIASATVGIMQRVHKHDISGVIIKNPILGYEHLLIEMRYKGAEHPARKSEHWRGSSIGYKDPRTEFGQLADPIRMHEKMVADLEATMTLEGGTDAVAAQLDQWPIDVSGAWFKAEWFTPELGTLIDPHDVPADVPRGKRGWDFGGGGKSRKSDPSASARVARGTNAPRKFYLWHTATKRGSPGDLEQFIRDQHSKDERDIDWSIPEDPGTGKNYADYIRRECTAGRFVTSSPEVKDKVVRAKPVSGQAQSHNFVIVRHPGWEEALNELVDFPYGEHDDIVDAISRAFAAVVAEPTHTPSFGGFVMDLS